MGKTNQGWDDQNKPAEDSQGTYLGEPLCRFSADRCKSIRLDGDDEARNGNVERMKC
jgi:hypothetical protein